MISPQEAGVADYTSDIEYSRKRLERYIDSMIKRSNMVDGSIRFSLDNKTSEYMSNFPNDGLAYDYDLYFSLTDKKLGYGFDIEWTKEKDWWKRKPIKPVQVYNKFYIPMFDNLESAKKYIREYKCR